MAVPHAQAKQMLEETKRREEEAIKRQAQAAKHFEEKAKEIEARFAATKAAGEALKLKELQEHNTKRVQKREAERLRRELELQAEAQAREAVRAHVMRDLAWRRFSSPHSLRGGVYPREPVLAGVLRACSAQVAYMPWPLPELYGGGSGGGGSAAAMAMASNPIPRSELSHLRQLFPQTFEAARRCPQTIDDFEALLARRAQGEEAGPLMDQSRQAIYVTAVGEIPSGWGPVLADACRFWFGACMKSAFAPGLCPPHRWPHLEAQPEPTSDALSVGLRASAAIISTKKKGARSQAAAVAAASASSDASEHRHEKEPSRLRDLPPPPPPLYVVDAVGDGPFVRGGAELKVTPIVPNQTSSYGASAVDPLHPALAPPEDAVAAAAAAEELASKAAKALAKGETSLSEANQAAANAEKAKAAVVREVDLVATHEYLGRLLREASHLSDAVMVVAVTVQPFADPRAQAKAALKHANRPRLRYRDPDAKARSDAEAAAEQEAAIQLGHYARRITPTATAHWSQQSIDLAQNTVVVSLRPPRKKPKRPRPPSDDDEDDATARAAADAARKAAQEALAAAVAARSISLLEEAIPLAAAAGVDKDEVAAAQKLLEQLCQEAEANLHKPRPATAEVVDVPTHLSAEGTAAAELTALLVTCRLVHFQRPLCANGHDTVAKVSALTDSALRGFGFKKAQVANFRKMVAKSNEASAKEKEKAAAEAAREKAEKEEEEEARVAEEKKDAEAAQATQEAKDNGDNDNGVNGKAGHDNNGGDGAAVSAGDGAAAAVNGAGGDDGSVGSGVGVQDEHLAHRLALTVNKSKMKTQSTLLVSGSRMLRHCVAAVPVAVSTALGLGPCLYGCACAMRPIPSEVPGGERAVPPPPPPPLLSKADYGSSSPGKVAKDGRAATEEDEDPFAPVQTKQAAGLAPDPPPLAVPAPLRCCPLCLAKVALSVDLGNAAFSPMARERLFLSLCSTSPELRDSGGRFSVTKLCAPDLKWSAAFVQAVESELFGSSPEGSLALAGHHASQPKSFDRMRHRFKSLGSSGQSQDESLNSFTGFVRFDNGHNGDDSSSSSSMSVGSVKGAPSLDDALARLSVEASNSSAAVLHRFHQQKQPSTSSPSSSSLEWQHPTRRLPLTRQSVLECAHPAPPPPYAGAERFLPTRNQNPHLPQEADGKAAAAAAAHAVATAALGGTKLGAHLPPWEAGPGLLWNGDSLVTRAPHVEARHGQVWLDPSRTLNGGVVQWESSKRFNIPKASDGDNSKDKEGANRAEEEDALAQAAAFASGAAKARSEAANHQKSKGGAGTSGDGRRSGSSSGGGDGGSIFSYGMFPLQRTRVVPEPPRPRWLPEPGSADTPTPGKGGEAGSGGNSTKSAVSFGDKESLASSAKKKGSRRASLAPVRR